MNNNKRKGGKKMKLITAIIQPEKLPDVKQALFDADVHKMTVSNVIGAGQQKGYTENYRGVVSEINLLKKVRIEIAVNDNFVDKTVEAIIKGARTGKIGDGKIFITDLKECIRIRTKETGKDAIG
jgi:nitrogen regulatory protein P-II 1